MADWLLKRRQGVLPIVAIQSDHSGLIGFRIDLLIAPVIDEIINPIVEYCGDRGLHLEELGLD